MFHRIVFLLPHSDRLYRPSSETRRVGNWSTVRLSTRCLVKSLFQWHDRACRQDRFKSTVQDLLNRERRPPPPPPRLLHCPPADRAANSSTPTRPRRIMTMDKTTKAEKMTTITSLHHQVRQTHTPIWKAHSAGTWRTSPDHNEMTWTDCSSREAWSWTDLSL